MKPTTPATPSLRRPRSPILLALGDVAIFVIFAVGGRATHAMPLGDSPAIDVLVVAAPFAVPWFFIDALLGGFRANVIANPRMLLTRAANAWLLAGSIGLIVRAAILQRGIALPFALVTLGFNGGLLLAWRLIVSRFTQR